jgi:hypothetical protein
VARGRACVWYSSRPGAAHPDLARVQVFHLKVQWKPGQSPHRLPRISGLPDRWPAQATTDTRRQQQDAPRQETIRQQQQACRQEQATIGQWQHVHEQQIRSRRQQAGCGGMHTSNRRTGGCSFPGEGGRSREKCKSGVEENRQHPGPAAPS